MPRLSAGYECLFAKVVTSNTDPAEIHVVGDHFREGEVRAGLPPLRLGDRQSLARFDAGR